MSVATKAPLKALGGLLYSGGPNDGSLPIVRGGPITVTIFSGGLTNNTSGSVFPITRSGEQAVFWSGAGRLNNAFVHQAQLSGVPIFFYDSAVPGLSGIGLAAPALIGCRLLGVLNTVATTSPISGSTNNSTAVVFFDTAFTSGLAVTTSSGAPGVTFTFSPEVVPVTQ